MVLENHSDRSLLFPQSYANIQQLAAATKASLQMPFNRMKPQDKMPPRFNVKGLSVAVRVLGHEIRHVTYKTTGKDLADLRYSCPDILRKLGQAAKEKKISFDALTIPSFDFPKRNLNEFDFNGFYTVQSWDPLCFENKTDAPDISESTVRLDGRCTCSSVVENSFAWGKDCIDDSEMQRITSLLSSKMQKYDGSVYLPKSTTVEDEWKEFMKLKSYHVWRKKMNSNGKYMYRICGSFDDVSAKAFYETQINDNYRCLWDSYALSIDTIEKDPQTACEIVRWTTKCPYPMKSREYIFLRNAKIYEDEKVAVVVSRSTDHPEYPESDTFVRVDTYESRMAIKPFGEFNQSGMEFVLVYSEDPQTVLPSYIIDMLASSGISEMMSKLHKASKELEDSN